jgi:DNA-binding NarL/FixJ family response regulator
MNILLVDDHVLIREAMRSALAELDHEAVVLEAGDGDECLRRVAERADLDLILLDLNLPDRDGYAVLAELRKRYPSVAVVVMSALQDRDAVVKALDLGAMGFIPKSAKRKVIISALQLVISGGVYIPPQALSRAEEAGTPVPTASRNAVPSASSSAGDRPTSRAAELASPEAGRDFSPLDLGLTDRQLDVLALMMKGKSNKAICRALNLAEATVKSHVTAILKALKATNRTEAVIAVSEMRWQLPSVGEE